MGSLSARARSGLAPDRLLTWSSLGLMGQGGDVNDDVYTWLGLAVGESNDTGSQ